MIHIDNGNKSLPDPGIPCCMGSAAMGHQHCTCWEPVFDSEVVEPHDGSLPKESPAMCHDCAYRKDSPERNGEEGFEGDEEQLFHIVATGNKFFCHQGVRKILKHRHPSGIEIDAHPAEYDWRFVTIDGETFPIKADGSAADICGGWCKNRKKFVEAKEQIQG